MPPLGQSLAKGLLSREIGQSSSLRYGRGVNQQKQQAEFLSKLEFEAKSTLIPLPPAMVTSGLPLVAKFNRNPSFNNCQLLAVGGEEGVVTITSTESVSTIEKGALDGSWRPRAHWSCHRNSIFDLAWAKSDSVMYTASGHQHVGVWDTDTATALAVAEGHEGSVKCISPLHLCEDVFVTGARDGRIMLYDARCPGFSSQSVGRRVHAGTDLDNAPVLSPIWVQQNAHTPHIASRGRVSTKVAKPLAATVTSVAFLPYSYLLASAGANDTVIKLWDLRMHGLPMCDLELPKSSALVGAGRLGGSKDNSTGGGSSGIPHEVAEFTCPARTSAVGVTHLTVSETGDRLLVSCLNSQHHLFALSQLFSGPLATWCAPPPAVKSSFYMRSAFSPCGDYILSGSRDCGAHIWMVANPQRPPITLPHEQEVTGVTWCGGDWSKVATCSDSGEVRVWTLNRLPARETWPIESVMPAMASHVAELDYSGYRNAEIEQRQKAQTAAGPLPASRPVDADYTRRGAAKPNIKRTVQLRLNLQPAPATELARTTRPVAVEPVKTNSPEAASVQSERIVPLLTVMEEPATTKHTALAHIAALTKDVLLAPGGGTPCLDSKLAPACAAAAHGSAPSSPVSSAPAQPAAPTGPPSVRRAVLPPVPIFSPAVNCWQEQPPRAGMLHHAFAAVTLPQAVTSETAATGDSGATASIRAVCGLGATMISKGLPQLCTQSPVRLPQRSGELGTDAPDDAAASGPQPGVTDGPRDQGLLGKSLLRPSEQPPEPLHSRSFLPSAGVLAAVWARPESPRTTSMVLNRFPTFLGAFSPSQSPSNGGCCPLSNGHCSGGYSTGCAVGTPTGSQRIASGQSYQAPQGVIDQILRNSPRHGSRTGLGGVLDGMLSHQLRRLSADELETDAVAVPRRLFVTDGDADGQHGNGASLPVGDTARNLGESRVAGSVASIVATVDSLLQHPNLQGRAPESSSGLMAARSPRPSVGPSMYDIRDGQDVGPALRYRAAHPDDMGPYVRFLNNAGEDEDANFRRNALQFTPDAEDMRFPWEGFAPTIRRNSIIATSTAEDTAEHDEDLVVLRRSDSGFIVHRGSQFSDDDSDSDWDFDPCGDKENVPPSEPLPVPAPASSSSTGGSSGYALFASPSPWDGQEVDQPLSLPLLEPFSTTPTRAATTTSIGAAAATVGTPEQRQVRPTTPLAAGYLSSMAQVQPESMPALDSEPTISAGIGQTSDTDTAGTYEGDCYTDDDDVRQMPNFVQERLPAADAFPRGPHCMDNGAGAVEVDMSRSQHRSFSGAERIDGITEEDTAQERHVPQQQCDTLTPTKRPRQTCSSSEDHDKGPNDRSPSPTRRVRSLGLLSGLAPTPSHGKQGWVGAFANAMPSPCIRGGRHGGASRLAPAPGAGYLVTIAATACAGIGSESPMPKVGTASRTGGRFTAASEDYRRRRAGEERERGFMSPFGFGKFTSTALDTTSPCVNTHHDVGVTGPGLEPYAVTGNGIGVEADDEHGVTKLQFSEDDEMEDMERSVRSLSCVFETQMQGGSTLMVPCTYPVEGDEAQEGGSLGQVEQQLRREILSFEEHPAACRQLLPRSSCDGLEVFDEGEKVGYFEPGASGSRGQGAEGQGHQRCFHFSTFSDRASPEQQHSHLVSRAHQLQASTLHLDENSRSSAVNVNGAAAVAPTGDGGLRTGCNGQGLVLPREQLGPSPVHSRVSCGSQALPEMLALSSALDGLSGGGSSHACQLHALPRAFTRLPANPNGVNAGNQGPAAGHVCCAAAEQEQLLLAPLLRKHRQQTLHQCWGDAAQRHPTPLGMRPSGPAIGLPLLPSRTLGPTGLMSPKYFR
ncbi:hypothetical protein Vafri_6864 [Volvox africanus]|uniref:Uncharacterized protein n=1 Tax=Volvox africanus TaxID=51714 RepID=A0A8J4F036_9CHLO|nr:hypothetical protein Vafri_6864 [Volvox africanus]